VVIIKKLHMTLSKTAISIIVFIATCVIGAIGWTFSYASQTADRLSDMNTGYQVADAMLAGRIDSLTTDIKAIKESLARIERKLDNQ
jgi:hypothetical protein